jgi:DNA processing protein
VEAVAKVAAGADAADRPVAPAAHAAGDGSDEPVEIAAALALSAVEGLGPGAARALVDRYGRPSNVLRRARARGRTGALESAGGRSLRREALEGLRSARPVPAARLRELAAKGIRIVRYGGPGYPASLRDLHHPPVVLYCRGALPLPEVAAVAVVGTRRATEYGRRMARDLAGELAARGVWIVSGMARGIDGAAHRAALEVRGRTVGILAGGVDVEYPAVHRRLFRDMRERAVLASEFPPGTRPAPGLFPRRNRIIAALARAVVVVQAPGRSGALITVSHALELGREVGAVPGPVGPEASAGVHELLRDGAAVVTSAHDVLELLGSPVGSASPRKDRHPGEGRNGLPPSARRELADQEGAACRVWEAASDGPCGAEGLVEASGLGHRAGRALLDRMELAGVLEALPGDRYERRSGVGAGR